MRNFRKEEKGESLEKKINLSIHTPQKAMPLFLKQNPKDKNPSDNTTIGLIHDSRHVGFQVVMQISHVLCWGAR